MMRHLTPADYRTMPWANGRGQTVELLRKDDADGRMLWRLSMATVADNGPFSLFPGINRSLTVIDGPGFDLVGERHLRADPLVPVGFSGDSVIAAANVRGSSQDFNVMVRAPLRMQVSVHRDGAIAADPGALWFCFALGPARVAGQALNRHDLLCEPKDFSVSGGPVIVVQIG